MFFTAVALGRICGFCFLFSRVFIEQFKFGSFGSGLDW